MNIFKSTYKNKNEDYEKKVQKVFDFNTKLLRITKLTAYELEELEDHEWDLGQYVLGVRRTCFKKYGWKTLLVIVPKGYSSTRVGYKGVNRPENWNIEIQGTCTLILPPEHEIPNILKIVERFAI